MGTLSTIILSRVSITILTLQIVVISVAAAQTTPRITPLIYRDSLAVAIDCEELFDDSRIRELHDGYPLSFELKLSLRKRVPLWTDSKIGAVKSRFRVTFRRWDSRYDLELVDFGRSHFSAHFETPDEILLELEERLFATIEHVSRLDSTSHYYIEVEVKYRNLTFDDVKSTEDWLTNGDNRGDFDTSETIDFGEHLVKFLWDIAGPGADSRKSTTREFKLGDLRISR